MEEDGDKKRHLPNRERERVEADDGDLGRSPGNREQLLAEMESQRSGEVHIEIGVMDDVKTPQERNAVQQDVPEVKSVVHQDERGRDFDPPRQIQNLQHSPPLAFDGPAEDHDRRDFRQLDDDSGAGSQGKIPGFAPEFRLDVMAERTATLQEIEQETRTYRNG